MRRDSLLHQHHVYFSAAAIAAHSSYREEGFRPRDVRFFVELFSNWGESPFAEAPIPVQNTQITRYVRGLVERGHARKRRLTRPERFELTRSGIVDLLSSLTHEGLGESSSRFFFVFFFLRNYRNRIELLVHQEGAQFPPHLQHKVSSLLDYKTLASREKRNIEARLARVDERIDFARKSSALVAASNELGLSFSEISKELERKFPYALNSQKPLSHLLSDLPESQQRWEVLYGNLRRVDQLWLPLRSQLLEQLKAIDALLRATGPGADTPLP